MDAATTSADPRWSIGEPAHGRFDWPCTSGRQAVSGLPAPGEVPPAPPPQLEGRVSTSPRPSTGSGVHPRQRGGSPSGLLGSEGVGQEAADAGGEVVLLAAVVVVGPGQDEPSVSPVGELAVEVVPQRVAWFEVAPGQQDRCRGVTEVVQPDAVRLLEPLDE